MADDDHYIPDTQNAHIDMKEFEMELEGIAAGLEGEELVKEEPWADIYTTTLNHFSEPPEEPNEDTLICRYLSPTKFLWFTSQFEIYFGSATDFNDRDESSIPVDYNNSVKRFLLKKRVVPLFWDDHVQRMQSHWLVSCWTKLDNPYDDYLLWHCYAEGIFGVGITIRYGTLRDFLKKECIGADHIDDFIPGYVAYGGPLKSPPFNKRKMFKNEKEIRFACQTELLVNHCVNISTLKSEIGLRLSPDSTQTHRDSVRTIWTSLGGEDRIQIAGE